MKAPDAKHVAETGTMEFWSVSDTIAVGRAVGCIDIPMATWFLGQCDTWVGTKAGPLFAFHDGEKVTAYEMQGRILFGTWIVRNHNRFRGIHLLVGSKVVQLGVTMSNLALGRVLVAHPTRDTFDRELRAAAARVNADVPL
jgi:hypothetical protein